jgi:hypothetical protein
MATGYYRIATGAKTSWAVNSNWYSGLTGTTTVASSGTLQASSTSILGKCSANTLTINGGKLTIGG